MITFHVVDMTCSHCVGTITKAVQAADKHAKVHIDLAGQLVRVEPFAANAAGLGDAIRLAGYAPTVLAT